MCIWEIDAAKRHCEYCSYWGGCEKRKVEPAKTVYEAAVEYANLIKGISGYNIFARTRLRPIVWQRNMAIYLLRKSGYSWNDIAKAFKMHHSATMYASAQVTKMLQMPKMYPDEMEVWNELIKNI